MKFLLLATFVIACTASAVYRNRNISVNDDGTILITSQSGKRVTITREPGLNGQKNIEIAISGPNMPTKRIEVTDDNLEQGIRGNQWSSVDSLNEEYRLKRGSSKSQGDILSEILREYQGVVDEVQYEKLLNRINKAVRKGEVSPQIYDLLEGLDQQQQQEQQQQYGSRFVGQYVQGQLQQQQQQQQYGNGILGQYVQGQQYPTGQYVQRQQYPLGQYEQGQQYPLGQYGQVQGLYGLYGQRQVFGTQYPYFYGRQFLTSTPNVNPLLAKILPVGQNYFGDLLATQQLYGGVQGRQVIPQGTWSSAVLGRNYLLGRLLGNQQLSNGRQVYGFQQTIPQVYQQQQQVENVLEQLNVQQQLQQVIQVIEQLYEIQQQQGQLSAQQVQQVQQVIDIVEQLIQEPLNQIQQQQIQQVIEQLNEIQQQQQQYGQFVGRQVGQVFGQQVGQRNVPLTLQQLTGIQQTRGTGYTYRQPVYYKGLGYRTVQQPYTVQGRTGNYVNTIPQVQVVY